MLTIASTGESLRSCFHHTIIHMVTATDAELKLFVNVIWHLIVLASTVFLEYRASTISFIYLPLFAFLLIGHLRCRSTPPPSRALSQTVLIEMNGTFCEMNRVNNCPIHHNKLPLFTFSAAVVVVGGHPF